MRHTMSAPLLDQLRENAPDVTIPAARFPDDPANARVLTTFALTPSALIGQGGEACVYALDGERVLRVHRPGPNETIVERRARLLEELAREASTLPFALPRVLEISRVHE